MDSENEGRTVFSDIPEPENESEDAAAENVPEGGAPPDGEAKDKRNVITKIFRRKRKNKGEDDGEENDGGDIIKKPKKKKLIIIIIILLAAGAAAFMFFKGGRNKDAMPQSVPVTVERRDIKNTVSGSSVIEPKDSYNVTAMVTGEITADTFSEGDTVKKNDILYQIDSETVRQSVQTAENSLEKAKNSLLQAEQSYKDAVKTKGDNALNNAGSIETARHSLEKAQLTYNDSLESYNDLSVTSSVSGTVSEVMVHEGDEIQAGASIAKVYSDKYLKLRLPFNKNDAESISVGDGATVTIAGTGDEVWGSVTEVSNADVATDSHAVVRYVTLELENPGALTVNDKATAVINGTASNDVGTFEYITDTTITAKAAGTVEELGIAANSSVYAGQVVAVLSSDTIDDTITTALNAVEDAEISLDKTIRSSDGSSDETSVLNAQISLNNAKISLEDAQISLDKAKQDLEDYTIKAPIDGTVVTKNKKAGDKLESGSAAASSSSGGTSAMAVIYDLSSVKFQLDIDETEVREISVGQEVTVTADALEGQTFTGKVTKVGVDGTSSNGVTTYPVDVEITEYGELLPGMNITAEIVTAEAENVLAVPVSSVQRGDVVYVKGEKTDENDTAPEGYMSVEVETGINDEDYIEIKSGLTEGQELMGMEISEGMSLEDMMNGGMPGMGGGMPGGGMGGGMSGGPPSGGGGMSGGPPSGGGAPGGMR